MFRILHVSDVHFGQDDPKGEQALITGALIESITRYSLSPDLIIFSGDLAHSGQRVQFERGQQWLRELCDRVPHARLCIVPGNHDVDRAKVKGPYLLHAAGSKETSFYDWKNEL